MSSGKMVALRPVLALITLVCLACVSSSQAAQWYASPSGSSGGTGSISSPWDLQTVLHGPAAVQPGDTIWMRAGNYSPPNGEYFLMDYLRGTAAAPIHLRAYPGERPTVTMWFRAAIDPVSADINPGAGYVWIQDVEFAGEPSMDGIDLNNGDSLKFINCWVHAVHADGIGDWAYSVANTRYGSRNSEIYGCVLGPVGYYDPNTRWHGHCIYSENEPNTGTKTIRCNIFRNPGEGQYTVHMYGQGAHTMNYVVQNNTVHDSYGFLMGSCLPADNLQMLGNYFHNMEAMIYFGSPWAPAYSNTNGVCNDNIVLNTYMGIWVNAWSSTNGYTASNNLVVWTPGTDMTYNHTLCIKPDPNGGYSATPPGTWPTYASTVELIPNTYDPNRANLTIFNWARATSVSVDVSALGMPNGSAWQLYDPENQYGSPVQSGSYNGTPISVTMTGAEFGVWVMKFTGTPTHQPPTVNAGAAQVIHPPVNTASLAGTVSDDNIAPAGAVTVTWSKVSGPGTVTFANANATATTATFSTTGTYVLQLLANDGALSGSGQVQISYVPNQAPAVSAGANQNINLPPGTALLAGTVSDDGLPVGAAVTSTWSLVSGPGTVTFTNANAPGTTATFSALGTYVLQLSASDTALSASATMQVVVQAPGAMPNPILHVPFDEGTGTTAADTTGNGHTATLHGGATWVAGKVGSHAVQFDKSTGYATIPNFAPPSQFSLSFWFQQNNHTGAQDQAEALFSWGQPYGGSNDVNVWFWDANAASGNPPNTLFSDLEDSAFTANWGAENMLNYPADANGNPIPGGDPNLNNGQWHFYCMTVGAIGMGTTVYVDGVQRGGSTALGGAAITPSTDIYIGARYNVAANRMDGGAIDDVRIYGSALTAGQVMTLYSPAPPNTAPTANASAAYPKVMIPNALMLAGTVSDDGLPNGTCTAAWSMVSGPGTVTFGSPAAASTTATFSTAGTYVLMLTANDSALTGTSSVTVTALAPGDFNGDGKVDGVDFLNWQSHYPTSSGATCDHGDANGDGKVDGVDFLVWQSHYHG